MSGGYSSKTLLQPRATHSYLAILAGESGWFSKVFALQPTLTSLFQSGILARDQKMVFYFNELFQVDDEKIHNSLFETNL